MVRCEMKTLIAICLFLIFFFFSLAFLEWEYVAFIVEVENLNVIYILKKLDAYKDRIITVEMVASKRIW